MGLNIKNKQVEDLAAEVAEITGETKTEAIRRALAERKERLALRGSRLGRDAMLEFLERDIWSAVPPDVLGRPVTKSEREDILGYGPHGV